MRTAALLVTLTITFTACGGSRPDAFVDAGWNAPALALAHVRVIDGTGRPAVDNQTVVIENGRIRDIGDARRVAVPPTAKVLDLSNRTIVPGLVGMHEHLFYQIQPKGSNPSGYLAQEPFAKLYLASGVTTIRTAGAADLDGDRRLKQRIDDGHAAGPKIHLTSPYLGAIGAAADPARAAALVNEWADEGATSVKAYTSVRSDDLKAAIQAAHARGMLVTGHLCSVGFRDAAALGIDNLEHGIAVDTEFDPEKLPDECPGQAQGMAALLKHEVSGDEIQQTIRVLVQKGVVVTSTLAVFESFTAIDRIIDPRIPELLAPRLRGQYADAYKGWTDASAPEAAFWWKILHKEMEFERAFVMAGGKLMAGVDPTGWGGVIAGSGDEHNLELLVDAGFSPVEAIQIASANGANFLRESKDIGTLAKGKKADLVVVDGNPATTISDMRRVVVVLKDGVAFNPERLIASSAGTVGEFDILWELRVLTRWPFNIIGGAVIALLVVRRLWRLSAPRPVPDRSPAPL